MGMFDEIATDIVRLKKSDGSSFGPYKSVVNGNKIAVLDGSMPVDDGDSIVRELPNGREEVYRVLHSQYSPELGPMPASYDLKVEKLNAIATASSRSKPSVIKIINNLHGNQSRVNIGSSDHSVNTSTDYAVFNSLRKALNESQIAAPIKSELIEAADQMEKAKQTGGFLKAYTDFVALAANHISIIAPFLPELTKLLST